MRRFFSNKAFKKILSILIIIAGNVGLAAAVEMFIVPNNLVTGGVAGIGLLLQRLLPSVPLSVFTFSINFAMLILGLFTLGKKFTATTVLSSVTYPVAMWFFENFYTAGKLTENDLLAALFAGAIVGASIGMVIREGASTGGLDIPELVIHKYTNIPVSVLVYTFDFIVILLLAFTHSAESVLCGIVMLVLTSLLIDKVLLLGHKKIQMKIVSLKHEEIKEALLKETDRGVTVLEGETGYLNMPVKVLLTVMSNREVLKTKKLVNDIDEVAFITISEVSEVRGRGFTLDKHYKDEQ